MTNPFATPDPTHPPRACSCVLDDDTGSNSGWHTRRLGDHGCYELRMHKSTRNADGSETTSCSRGEGKASCAESGESCLYAGTMAAIEPCPKYRSACALNASRSHDAAA